MSSYLLLTVFVMAIMTYLPRMLPLTFYTFASILCALCCFIGIDISKHSICNWTYGQCFGWRTGGYLLRLSSKRPGFCCLCDRYMQFHCAHTDSILDGIFLLIHDILW